LEVRKGNKRYLEAVPKTKDRQNIAPKHTLTNRLIVNTFTNELVPTLVPNNNLARANFTNHKLTLVKIFILLQEKLFI